jgi:trigger factor
MQITETKTEGLSREFKVALPAKEIEEKISHRLKDIAKTAQLPGFRPGKVPVALLRKRYGPSIMGEILERAVSDSSQQALAEKGIRPAMQPEIEITSFEDGKDLEYTMAVESLPAIEPMDFSKLKLERFVCEPDEKAIETALDNLADANKSSEALSSSRKSKNGDVVVIDFVGTVDGQEFPGGKADGYQLELGSGSFIPGFEEQLVGVSVGDHVEVKVSFPAEYGAAELAGKDAVFQVYVKELRETAAAAVDDELAKKVGMEDLGKLREAIAEEQAREFNSMARMLLKRKLLDELEEAHEFEVPAKLLDREFDAVWAQYEEQKEPGDAADDDEGLTEDEQKEEFRAIAERRVKLGLLLAEVGQTNSIQLNQEDINQAVMEEARRHPGQEQAVIDHFKNNPEAMEQVTAPVYEEKVVDFIVELATVKDKKTTMAKLMAALQEDSETAEKEKGAAKKKPILKAKPKAEADDAAKPAKKKKAPAKKAAKKKD